MHVIIIDVMIGKGNGYAVEGEGSCYQSIKDRIR